MMENNATAEGTLLHRASKEIKKSKVFQKAGAIGIGIGIATAAMAYAPVDNPAAPDDALAYTQYEKIVTNGHGYINPSYLVIHETADPGATADQLMRYWQNNHNAYVVHYTMDLDGDVVYHAMNDNRKAWHVGNGNAYTVGIELCHATNQSDFNEQWNEAVKWTGDYLHKKGWGTNRLLCHNDCRLKWGGTDHTDPLGYFESYGKSWSQFKAAVAAYMGSGEVGNGGSVEQGGGTAVSGSGGGSNISVGTYTVTASALNVRTGPGVNYAKKSYSQLTANAKAHAYSNGCLKTGTRVTVYECTNGWARIPSGWVSTAYLSKSGSSSVPSSTSGTYVVDVNTRLNVRTGAGTNYRITGSLPDGYKLYNVTISNGWGKYQAYAGTRYVSAQYLDAA